MEDFIQHKDKGNGKMSSKNFKGAIQEYTFVINGLSAENDEQAILKGVCYLNRALCKMYQTDFKGALQDTDECLNFYQTLRPDNQMANISPEAIGQDPLTQILSLIYCRKGQIHHLQEHFLLALQNYSIATMLLPDCEAQTHMKELMSQLGLPSDFDQSDPDFKMFSPIILQFLNEANLQVALINLFMYLRQSNDISTELVSKWDISNVVGVITPALSLYLDNEMIQIAGISALRELAMRGINVWHAYPVYFAIFDHWQNNSGVIGELLKLFLYAPEETTEIFLKQGFLQPIADSLKLEITDEEAECACIILFKLIQNQNIATEATAYDVLETVFERKTPGALLLLSKLIILHDVACRALTEKSIDWILPALSGNHSDMEPLAHHRPPQLKEQPFKDIENAENSKENTENSKEGAENSKEAENSDNTEKDPEPEVLPPRKIFVDVKEDNQLIVAATFVIADMLKEGENKELLKDCAEKSFKPVFEVINKYKKDEIILSNGMAVLALATPYMISSVVEMKLIQFTSVILSLNINDEYVVANSLMLLRNAAANGLVENIKASHTILPAMRKALKTHTNVQDVIENGVILAILCDTPDKNELLKAGVSLYPESKVLKPYAVDLVKLVQESQQN